jgi:hypothetical protein
VPAIDVDIQRTELHGRGGEQPLLRGSRRTAGSDRCRGGPRHCGRLDAEAAGGGSGSSWRQEVRCDRRGLPLRGRSSRGGGSWVGYVIPERSLGLGSTSRGSAVRLAEPFRK